MAPIKEFRNIVKKSEWDYVLERAENLAARWPREYFQGFIELVKDLRRQISELSGGKSGICWMTETGEKVYLKSPIYIEIGGYSWKIVVREEGTLIISPYHSVNIHANFREGSIELE